MKRIITIVAVLSMALLAPFRAAAQVVATILEQTLTPSVPDVNENNRIYASMSYTIKVTGAEGHSLRVEVPWKDVQGKPVYFNIDNNEEALSTESVSITASTDTIEGWCGVYHDAFWLKPGVHRLNGTIRIFDETLGKYITVNGAKKQTFSFTSTKKAPGAKITNCYIEHNQYHNNAKGMYVRYEYEANWMKGKEIKYDVTLYRSNGSVLGNKNGTVEKVSGSGTATYTFCSWTDRWAHFPYAGMNVSKGKTNCYAMIRLYDAKTGKLLASSKKLDFYVTR